MPSNISTPALLQRHLRPIKAGAHHSSWIVADFGDRDYRLIAYVWLDGELCEIERGSERYPYSELWWQLAALDIGNRKSWLIGWRTRYAMDRADFVAALAAGAVQLPRGKDKKGKAKHSGHLTYNRRIVEVDIVCGRNAIKLLDWENFGVKPEHFSSFATSAAHVDGVEVLRQTLRNADAVGLAFDKTTAAQIGWTKFRRDCQPDSLAVNLDHDARALERAAYFGGRNECYRLGDIPGTTFSLDVKSCYANICATELLPAWLVEEYRDGCKLEVIELQTQFHWFADVEIVTDQPDYPVDWSDAPIYPVGHFRTSLAWPELLHALSRDRVVKIHRAAKYAARPVMQRYAEWYADARGRLAAQDRHEFTPALKAIFNASLGYTARERYDWAPWPQELGHKYWIGKAPNPEGGDESVDAQKLDTEARWLQIAGEPREAMPFLHATICSYARVRLLEIFETAGRENILYCDTDGILCNKLAAARLLCLLGTNEGGMHGLQRRFEPGSARIQGQKSYSIGDQFIQAGVVKSRVSALTRKRVLTTETGVVDSKGLVRPFVMRCIDGINEIE